MLDQLLASVQWHLLLGALDQLFTISFWNSVLLKLDPIECAGSITGIAGAYLMAQNTKHSGKAYIFWLTSSCTMSLFALQQRHPALALEQIAFTFINLLGFWRWLIKAPLTPQPTTLRRT